MAIQNDGAGFPFDSYAVKNMKRAAKLLVESDGYLVLKREDLHINLDEFERNYKDMLPENFASYLKEVAKAQEKAKQEVAPIEVLGGEPPSDLDKEFLPTLSTEDGYDVNDGGPHPSAKHGGDMVSLDPAENMYWGSGDKSLKVLATEALPEGMDRHSYEHKFQHLHKDYRTTKGTDTTQDAPRVMSLWEKIRNYLRI